MSVAGTISWRALRAEATETLRAAGLASPEVDAWRIVEEASGLSGAEWVLRADEPARRRGVVALDAMVGRRAAGEPLQYVLGRWGFRSLDLMVDRRVLIPRPETEQVAGAAVEETRRMEGPATVADLGTGSGAIALALAVEVPSAQVWATDRSAAALAVARANLAGIGRSGRRVRLVEGDWFGALPDVLRGRMDVVVANPPYVAAGEPLPPEVADWEPAEALVAGPTGIEDLTRIVAEAPSWLSRPGALVVELAPHQSEPVARLAGQAGFAEVEVRPDLAGRARMVVARFGPDGS
jgi:release factor glutamine methyltransferase